MNQIVCNFVVIDLIYGLFVINWYCVLQVEVLIKIGWLYIQGEFDMILYVIDQLFDGVIVVDGGVNVGFVCVFVVYWLCECGGCVYVFELQCMLFYVFGGIVVFNQFDNFYLLNMGLVVVNGMMKVFDVDYGQDVDFGQVLFVDV